MSDDDRDDAWLAGKRVAEFLYEMDRFELAFNGGQPKALKLAVERCGFYDMPLPEWVRRAVLARLNEVKRPKGTPTKMDVHAIRWDAVRELRDRRKEKDKIVPRKGDAFDLVSELLNGTEAEGSRDTVEASYKLVQRLVKSGRGPIF